MTGRYRDVAVIGAGPAGLAAAWALADSGAVVTLYDRRAEPGGLLRTDVLNGARVDPAVQLLGSYYRETFRLAREVGVSDRLARAPGRDALWRRGRLHGLTYGSVASMAVSSALPTGLKLRLASRYAPFLNRNAAVLDVNEPVRAAQAGFDDESIAEWGARELGPDFVELLAYPQLGAYYGATPERTAAGFYHALARAGLDVSVYAVRGGMGVLAQAVAAALEARGARFVGGAAVLRVEAGPAGVEVTTESRGARHDAAVLAVPAPVALALCAFDDPVRGWLERVRTAPAASLGVLVEGRIGGDVFGMSFPRTEPPGESIVAICVQSRKSAELPGGEGRDALVVYPAPARVSELSDDAAAASARLLPAVERAIPEIRDRIRRAKLYRFADGGTLFYPGYLRHLSAFDPAWLPARLALAGDYLVAPTVEGAVRSGSAAARRLLSD